MDGAARKRQLTGKPEASESQEHWLFFCPADAKDFAIRAIILLQCGTLLLDGLAKHRLVQYLNSFQTKQTL